MSKSQKNAVTVTFECASEEMAKLIADKIHAKCSGLEDYVESELGLNYEKNIVYVAVGECCNKFTFMAALGELIGLEVFHANSRTKDNTVVELKEMDSF